MKFFHFEEFIVSVTSLIICLFLFFFLLEWRFVFATPTRLTRKTKIDASHLGVIPSAELPSRLSQVKPATAEFDLVLNFSP